MDLSKVKRLGQLAAKLGVGAHTLVEHLQSHGFDGVDPSPNTKLSQEQIDLLIKDFHKDSQMKEKARSIKIGVAKGEESSGKTIIGGGFRKVQEEEDVLIKGSLRTSETLEKKPEAPKEEEVVRPEKTKIAGPKVIGKVDLTGGKKEKEEAAAETPAAEKKEEKKSEAPEEKETAVPAAEEKPKDETIKAKAEKLKGPKILGKIELPAKAEKKAERKPVASSSEDKERRKQRRRKRIVKGGAGKAGTKAKTRPQEREITEKEIEEKLKETMSKIAGIGAPKGKALRTKRRKEKQKEAEREQIAQDENKVLQVTEFISVSELASLLNVKPADVLGVCMSLGVIASINQRLDAEIIELIASEYDHEVEFIDVDEGIIEEEEEDNPEDLEPRPPIVTIMGHVDHGKTSLLDFIRSSNVIAGEKGGITQHIGAYKVNLENGKSITFLDTPGHEAFTAMRARGAKLTDIAVIVVAADDAIMPQTKEAISHAQAAGVPIVFAINKVDKENADPEKIKEQLANMNLLVEDWGGKYQSEDVSAKTGLNVESLLEKILLEAEMLDLKANPNKNARGTVVEASLDKGRGYVATILVQEGTLRVGDVMVAGSHMGKVKALYNERDQRVKEAGPSDPVQILGLDGAPQAGEKFKVYNSESEAKTVANKRAQIEREQGLRAQKHITLDEIGRRLALGNFKELNVIIKGDVDGSVEALADSLIKLSTEEIHVNVVHKGVGAITETDVMLASASDAVIIGFQVRPSVQARQLAEKEHIEIRLYSVIYDAIDEVKAAMEGMLEPKIEEKVLGNAEVRETFKITKVGTVAGCFVIDGKIPRNAKARVVRDGIVVYTGELASLKRFKEDVKEVRSGMECGLNIKDFNDIKVGDIIEAYTEVEIARTLD